MGAEIGGKTVFALLCGIKRQLQKEIKNYIGCNLKKVEMVESDSNVLSLVFTLLMIDGTETKTSFQLKGLLSEKEKENINAFLTNISLTDGVLKINDKTVLTEEELSDFKQYSDDNLEEAKKYVDMNSVKKEEINKKNDLFQFEVMPEPSSVLNKVIQYVGENSENYKRGSFYFSDGKSFSLIAEGSNNIWIGTKNELDNLTVAQIDIYTLFVTTDEN